MFSSRKKKNNVYPCKPQFYYIKVGFNGVKIIKACFRDASSGAPRFLQAATYEEACHYGVRDYQHVIN